MFSFTLVIEAGLRAPNFISGPYHTAVIGQDTFYIAKLNVRSSR